MKTSHPNFSAWVIWLQWVAASTGAFLVVGLLFARFQHTEYALRLLTSAVSGNIVGLSQWLVLRHYLGSKVRFWIPATIGAAVLNTALTLLIAGGLVGQVSQSSVIQVILMSLLSTVLVGSITGIAQWFVLRFAVPRAQWWVFGTLFATILLAFIGGFLSTAMMHAFGLESTGTLGEVIRAIMPELIRGALLAWLVYQNYAPRDRTQWITAPENQAAG